MYYPLSQIKTNLYTNGTELVYKSNNQKYIGYYFKTSDGKYFTGKTPDEKNTQELINISNSVLSSQYDNLNVTAFEGFTQVYLNQNNNISEQYNKLNNNLQEVKKQPISYNPKPQQSDYDLGEFVRYFVKKNNELIYIEIDKETYNNISNQSQEYLWQLYTSFKFTWKLTGNKEEVYKINKKVTEYMIFKFQFPSFDKFLKKDFLKFWKA